ncbi:hypothetical protein BDW75DRAFT_232252 [Aspergillus navahoensis]
MTVQLKNLEAARAEQNYMIAKRETEIGKLKKEENSLSSFRTQLLEKEEECQRVQADFSAVQNELAEGVEDQKYSGNGNAHQTLQNQLLSIQKTLAQKEEYLDQGKGKAKTEIHSLLKRVQDSESGMKVVRETLHRMNVAHLQQLLPENLDQLARMLQAKNAKRANSRTGSHGVYHTEAQTDTSADGPKTPANHTDPSKQAGSIVPFSSIIQGSSPVPYAVADNEPFDISALPQTPERATSLQEPTDPARPVKRNSLTENARETRGKTQTLTFIIGPGASIDQGNEQSKKPVTCRKDSLQVPDSQGKDMRSDVLESSLNGDNITRTHRRTYSKRQRENIIDEQKMRSKRAKISSTSGIITQTSTEPELDDLRRSPTRPAPGSSRTSSTILNPDQMDSNRGKRRTGRKTRGYDSPGDKYNARFSRRAEK